MNERKVPMSEDMLVSRMKAVGVIVVLVVIVWLLLQVWDWIDGNVLWS